MYIFTYFLPHFYSCNDKSVDNYYADLATGCQAFHLCEYRIRGHSNSNFGHRKALSDTSTNYNSVLRNRKLNSFQNLNRVTYSSISSPQSFNQSRFVKTSFLCPAGTIFHQKHQVCVWWYSFDCTTAPSFYPQQDCSYCSRNLLDAAESASSRNSRNSKTNYLKPELNSKSSYINIENKGEIKQIVQSEMKSQKKLKRSYDPYFRTKIHFPSGQLNPNLLDEIFEFEKNRYKYNAHGKIVPKKFTNEETTTIRVEKKQSLPFIATKISPEKPKTIKRIPKKFKRKVVTSFVRMNTGRSLSLFREKIKALNFKNRFANIEHRKAPPKISIETPSHPTHEIQFNHNSKISQEPKLTVLGPINTHHTLRNRIKKNPTIQKSYLPPNAFPQNPTIQTSYLPPIAFPQNPTIQTSYLPPNPSPENPSDFESGYVVHQENINFNVPRDENFLLYPQDKTSILTTKSPFTNDKTEVQYIVSENFDKGTFTGNTDLSNNGYTFQNFKLGSSNSNGFHMEKQNVFNENESPTKVPAVSNEVVLLVGTNYDRTAGWSVNRTNVNSDLGEANKEIRYHEFVLSNHMNFAKNDKL